MPIFKTPPRRELTERELEDLARWLGLRIHSQTIDERNKYGHDIPYEMIRVHIYDDSGQIEIISNLVGAGVLELGIDDDGVHAVLTTKDSTIIRCLGNSIGNVVLDCALKYLKV